MKWAMPTTLVGSGATDCGASRRSRPLSFTPASVLKLAPDYGRLGDGLAEARNLLACFKISALMNARIVASRHCGTTTNLARWSSRISRQSTVGSQ